MPISHRRNLRAPVDLPPKLMEHLESTAKRLDIPRTQLLRLLVIYGLQDLKNSSNEEQFVSSLFSLESPTTINNLITTKE